MNQPIAPASWTIQLIVLASSQLIVLAVGVATFAVLSRILGPTPFAQFAVVSFLFTASVIIFDLSAMGWIITGLGVNRFVVAKQTVLLSAILSCLLLAVLFFAINGHFPGGRIPNICLLALEAAAVAQLAQQVSRARLVLASKYKLVALADLSSVVAAAAIAVSLAVLGASSQVLLLQLVLGIYIKGVLLWVLARARGDYPVDPDRRFSPALYFGLANIPLNSAAYAARAIDSALVPYVTPIAVAASYARAYQIAVAPAVQAQVSIAPFGVREIAKRREGNRDTAVVWFAGLAVSTAAAATIILASPILDHVLFGPQWTDPSLYLTVMAFSLPATTLASIATWYRQVDSSLIRSCIHLFTAVITPLACVGVAALAGVPGLVLTFIALQGVVSPIAISAINSDVLPSRWQPRAAAILLAFALMLGLSFLRIDFTSLA